MPSVSLSESEREGAFAPEAIREFTLFRVGRYRLGIEVSVVREIVNPLPITPLPGSEPYVRGLVNLRGRIVTLLDLGVRFGTGAVTERDEYNIVLVEEAGCVAGLAVDDIVHIARLPSSEIMSSRDALARIGMSSGDIVGAGEIGDQLFYAVDTEAIFSSTFA